MSKQVKLQVGEASDGTWYWRRRVNGRITAHGADYNRKADAVRGLLDDIISVDSMICWILGTNPTDVKTLRDELRKMVEAVK